MNSKNDPSIVLMFITWYQCINVVLMKINVVCSVCQEWRQILNSAGAHRDQLILHSVFDALH